MKLLFFLIFVMTSQWITYGKGQPGPPPPPPPHALYTTRLPYPTATPINIKTILEEIRRKTNEITMHNNLNIQIEKQIVYFISNNKTHTKVDDYNDFISKIPHDYIIGAPIIGAHKFHLEERTWNEARKICIEEGGNLAVITSREEEEFIRNLQSSHGVTNSFLGFHDLFKRDEWVTVRGDSLYDVGYVHWKRGQPDNMLGQEECGSYYITGYAPDEGGLNDENCNRRLPFFCKIDLNCLATSD